MRRADRLFRIVQSLRRRRLTTAERLAEELEVSRRTVYRDIADLIGSGVPIVGEAGVGYALDRGFELPPLMFTEPEIEALVLGARVVESWADPELQEAARQALARIEAALPERLREAVATSKVFAPGFHVPPEAARELRPLRAAIRQRRKVRLAYVDRDEQPTERTIRPLGLFFWGRTWTLAAFCELRADFRAFRLDRVRAAVPLDEPFTDERGRTLADFIRTVSEERRGRAPRCEE